jgi:putative Ca2+/H+ antiporter (TMEM165/GDT1 family)
LLVTAAEMGDKTQLLAMSLAARYRQPGPILGGILVATIVNHALAAMVGVHASGWIDPGVLRWVLGLGFLAFAAWTLIPDELDEDGEATPRTDWGPFLTTAVLFFFAEMGDKTQLATIALAARHQQTLAVTTGTTLGMMIADGLAVVAGDTLADRIDPTWMRRLAAGLFAALGLATLLWPA